MNLSYTLYQNYFKNNLYIYSAILQICLCLLGLYLIWTHNSDRIIFEKVTEYAIFLLLLSDVLIYNIVNEFHFSLLIIIEWVFVAIFIGEVLFNQFYNKVSKEYQMLLTGFRILFLVIRLLIGVARLHVIHQDNQERKDLSLNITSPNVTTLVTFRLLHSSV